MKLTWVGLVMRRLKILFLPSRSWYPSETNPTAGVFVREHAKAVSLYHDVTVLYPYFGTNRSIKKPLQVFEQIEDGIRVIRIVCQWRVSLSNYLLYYWAIFAGFRRLVKEGWKPDIIHAHVYSAGLPAWLLSRIFKVPFVITEHWTGFVRGKLTIMEQTKARFVMRRAGVVLPVSSHLRQHIEAYGVKGRFRVIPNPVDTGIFYPLPSRNKGKKNILSVTGLNPKKGIPYLLQALSQVKEDRRDFVLDIVGGGPNRSEYERLARELGLDEVARFHGLKPREEVARLMRNCDFFVQASLWETFGVVYIEAMACGKPVIASDIGGPKEIINHDTGILVPPGNTEALAKATTYMLDNYQNYSSEKISQYAREKFGYETVGRQLSEVYQAVLAGESMRKYEPEKYWQERLSRNFSLGGAGHTGLGLEYNKWLYKARIRALNKLIKEERMNPWGKQVLDIGCGTGFYIDYWDRLEVAGVVGLDITEVSISRLATIYPKYKFIRADITAKALELKGEFDIITAFDVLFHIVDEDKFEQAIGNIRRFCHKKTLILISDCFLKESRPLGFHENYRTIHRYQEVLESNGLRIVRIIPIFFIMGNHKVRRILSLGNRLGLPGRLMNYLLGGSLYLVDGIILRYVKDSPGTKLLLTQLGE